MSGSSRQGRWVASFVTEEDIAKLRAARYLTAEILHRLPTEGQVIPTPRSGERVVFVSHFLRGLGFSHNPFVRGLMFYYGLDFHDLAPNSIILISSFIVTCEAPMNSSTLRLVAQDLQREAASDRGGAGGVRWSLSEQAYQRWLAKRILQGIFRLMAAGVVLYHRAPWFQVGSCAYVPIQPPNSACIMD